VIAGAHYDAWVYGASDPSSGVAVLMETAHVLSQLSQRGWKPERPILFAFWDAEEYGMHGSTNWVKQNSSEVQAAIYWNMDTAVRGKDFAAHLAPGLRIPLRKVLQYVDDPGSQRLLSDLYTVFDLPGFTADTAPFTGLAGVPTAEISFGRFYPLYHTLYDDLFWFEQYADPDFRYSASLSKVLSLGIYLWATEQILPYQFSEIGTFGQHHLAEIKNNFPELGQNTQVKNLSSQIAEYQRVARKFESAKKAHQGDIDVSINVLLQRAIGCFFSRQQTDFATANALVGPDHLTGCNAEAFPALQRALHSKKSVEEELERLRTAYAGATGFLQEATAMLSRR
ncbi:MAG TPA: M28 family peptidase, partial [Acidobacteriota bacterium]